MTLMYIFTFMLLVASVTFMVLYLDCKKTKKDKYEPNLSSQSNSDVLKKDLASAIMSQSSQLTQKTADCISSKYDLNVNSDPLKMVSAISWWCLGGQDPRENPVCMKYLSDGLNHNFNKLGQECT